MKLQVNVVVPTYNGHKWLQPLWDALNTTISESINWRLTLVDDGSTDGTKGWAAKNPKINYISQEANLGFAKACNMGARNFDSEYILFLNNDTVPKNGFLEAMIKTHEDDSMIGAVGAKLLFPGEKTCAHAGLKWEASGFPYEYGKGAYANLPDISITREMEGVTAACMLIKKNLFDKLDGFSEDFVNGWEDGDLCLRIRELGRIIFYCAEAQVIHYLYGSEENGRFLHEVENKQTFMEKWIHRRRIDIIAPFWMAVAATWECNLRCKHCGIWRKRVDKPGIDVDAFQLSVANDFFSNITSIAIFGGEPTMNNDICDLIAVCANRWSGQEIGVVTNGYNTKNQKSIWQTIKNNIRCNLTVRVSIDGREKVHDKLRGVKGSFAQAVDTAIFVNTLWPRKGAISITVYPDTVDEIPYLIEFVENLGINFCLRAAVSGSYFGGKVDQKWTPETIDKLEKIIKETPSNLFVFDRFIKAIPEHLRTGLHLPCEAYRKALVIDTDLSTSICHELPAFTQLEEIPKVWGRTAGWCQSGIDCLTGKCWKPSCALDGPGALQYILD